MTLDQIHELFKPQLDEAEPITQDDIRHRLKLYAAQDHVTQDRINQKKELLDSKLGQKQVFYGLEKPGHLEILSAWDGDFSNLLKYELDEVRTQEGQIPWFKDVSAT